MRRPCVYILASGFHGTLYIGVTSDLPAREWEHWARVKPDSFTARYKVNRLVWFDVFDTMNEAIAREKAMKKWRRAWKIELIEEHNPQWHPVCPETGEFLRDYQE